MRGSLSLKSFFSLRCFVSNLKFVLNVSLVNDNVVLDDDAVFFPNDNIFLRCTLDIGIDLHLGIVVIIVAFLEVVRLVVFELLQTNLKFVSLQPEEVSLLLPVVSILLELDQLHLQRFGLVLPVVPFFLEVHGVQLHVVDLATQGLHDVIQGPHLLHLALDDQRPSFKVFGQDLKSMNSTLACIELLKVTS